MQIAFETCFMLIVIAFRWLWRNKMGRISVETFKRLVQDRIESQEISKNRAIKNKWEPREEIRGLRWKNRRLLLNSIQFRRKSRKSDVDIKRREWKKTTAPSTRRRCRRTAQHTKHTHTHTHTHTQNAELKRKRERKHDDNKGRTKRSPFFPVRVVRFSLRTSPALRRARESGSATKGTPADQAPPPLVSWRPRRAEPLAPTVARWLVEAGWSRGGGGSSRVGEELQAPPPRFLLLQVRHQSRCVNGQCGLTPDGRVSPALSLRASGFCANLRVPVVRVRAFSGVCGARVLQWHTHTRRAASRVSCVSCVWQWPVRPVSACVFFYVVVVVVLTSVVCCCSTTACVCVGKRKSEWWKKKSAGRRRWLISPAAKQKKEGPRQKSRSSR